MLKDNIFFKIGEQFKVVFSNSMQSFPNENHCKCYKKFASRSWPMLFTLFLTHTLSSFEKQKNIAIAGDHSKIMYGPIRGGGSLKVYENIKGEREGLRESILML